MEQQNIEERVRELGARGGGWICDIPLTGGVWTGGNRAVPHTRLKRIVQALADVMDKPLPRCRILDLGSLEGLFPIELARQGAETVGVEIRRCNLDKAEFARDVLGLANLRFRQDDVRNLSVAGYGRFDAIICSGILYHLPAGDALDLIHMMCAMTDRAVIIDTHVALAAEREVTHRGQSYWGRDHFEFAPGTSEEQKAESRLSSADNETSFWLTRPSLINAMSAAGFTSVYECFTPPHLNYGRPGLESLDRVTFVGIKGEKVRLNSSPAANDLDERWPEGALAYAPPSPSLRTLGRKLARRLLRR